MALQECGLNLNRVSKELQPHGSLEFPCAGYSSHHTEKQKDIIPWHWHEEIAALCGFDSQSNFAKMFKRFYNCTPREYRNIPDLRVYGREEEPCRKCHSTIERIVVSEKE